MSTETTEQFNIRDAPDWDSGEVNDAITHDFG